MMRALAIATVLIQHGAEFLESRGNAIAATLRLITGDPVSRESPAAQPDA